MRSDVKEEEGTSSSRHPAFPKWTSDVKYSGAKKVVPGRIYSMTIHPKTDNLLVILISGKLDQQIAAGDKDGYLGFWSLPHSYGSDSLPKLENGMLDVSEQGKTWQFKLSNEYVILYKSTDTLKYRDFPNSFGNCYLLLGRLHVYFTILINHLCIHVVTTKP